MHLTWVRMCLHAESQSSTRTSLCCTVLLKNDEKHCTECIAVPADMGLADTETTSLCRVDMYQRLCPYCRIEGVQQVTPGESTALL